MTKTILSILFLVVAAAGIGCAALSELVTPARIEQRAVNYAADAGVTDPAEFEGYQNLEKAIRLEAQVGQAHQIKQLAFQQMAENDQLAYAQLNDIVVNNRTIGQAREEALFGPTGLLSVGLSMIGAGGFAGLLGLMRKRPGDVTPEEMEAALIEFKSELTEKDKQLLEIIKGVQNFININESGTKQVDGANAVSALKVSLAAVQSTNTKTAVATLKAKENL